MSGRAGPADPPDLRLVNVLPRALAHYADNFAALLRITSRSVTLPAWVSVEGTGWRRPLVAAVHTGRALRPFRGHTIVLWPALGLLEPLLWLRQRHRVTVVIHDAAPLRRQLGYGRVANALGRWAQARGVAVLVHSAEAGRELRRRGWAPCAVVPLPVGWCRPESSRRSGVRVLGQYKPSRDTGVLATLSASGESGPFVIMGRGWPPVAGWELVEGFLEESELDAVLSRSEAVVIPYQRVWQSDIAVRALEAQTAVVCAYAQGIALTWGEDWPGFVGADGWPAALQRARAVSPEDLHDRWRAGRERCASALAALLGLEAEASLEAVQARSATRPDAGC